MDSNYDNIANKVTRIASSISDKLGVTPFRMSLPVLKILRYNRYSQMFLGLIFDLVILVLFGLSVTLIYSLLLLDIDTKKFEFAILRSMGLDKKGVVLLILTQTTFFIIPALIIGHLFSWFFLNMIANKFKEGLDINMSSFPKGKSFILSTFLGILVPIISSLIPIKQALK